MNRSPRSPWWSITVIGQVVSYILMAAATFALNWDPNAPGEWFTSHQLMYGLMSNLKRPAGIIFPLSFVGLLVFQALRVGLRRALARAVACRLLDDLRREVFFDEEGDVHHHRVTLFRWRRAYLVVWARSGHTMQRSRTRFQAPKDYPDRAEGVAGKCWARKGMVEVYGLPDLSGLAPVQVESSAAMRDYASRTWVTPDWLKRRVTAGGSVYRSFVALHVEVDGEPWGVIVLDSKNPKGPDPAATREKFGLLASVLGRLIERGVI